GELGAKVPAILFWSYAATLFNAREAKRVFVLVGLSGSVACIVAGSRIGSFSRAFGTENLLLVLVALLGGLALLLRGGRQSGAGRAAPAVAARGDLLALPHVRHMALLVASAAVTLLVTDYLFLSAARARYAGPQLAGFLGTFYSAASFL